jgi:hypothetical protein
VKPTARTRAWVSLWLSLVFAPGAARAAPVVYASAADDGANSGVAALSPDSLAVVLHLYLDPGEFAYEYVVGFETTPGLGLQSFSPDHSSATVNFNAPAGTLALTESLGEGTTGPVRIGSLTVLPTAAGGELRLVDLPTASTPMLTNADFGFTLIPVPQTIALVHDVPEPDGRLLLGACVLAVASALRRAAAHP